MHAPQSELPRLTADILERVRARAPARPLHHQCGGAGVHRQHAARRRRGAVDDDRAGGDRRLHGERRCAAGQSRHLRCRAPRGGRDRRSRSRPRRAGPWVLDPVFIDRSPARAAYARSLADRKPAAIRLNRPEFAALADSEPDGEALTRYALDSSTVIGAHRRDRPGHRRRAPDHRRERPSADGTRHRHGLRRLGARRRLPRGRERCAGRDRGGAARARRRRRNGCGRGARGRAASRSRSSMRCTISTAPR